MNAGGCRGFVGSVRLLASGRAKWARSILEDCSTDLANLGGPDLAALAFMASHALIGAVGGLLAEALMLITNIINIYRTHSMNRILKLAGTQHGED